MRTYLLRVKHMMSF